MFQQELLFKLLLYINLPCFSDPPCAEGIRLKNYASTLLMLNSLLCATINIFLNELTADIFVAGELKVSRYPILPWLTDTSLWTRKLNPVQLGIILVCKRTRI